MRSAYRRGDRWQRERAGADSFARRPRHRQLPQYPNQGVAEGANGFMNDSRPLGAKRRLRSAPRAMPPERQKIARVATPARPFPHGPLTRNLSVAASAVG